MEVRPYTQFYARLMGTFSLSFNGQMIPIDANPQAKYMRLLLLLIKSGNEGMSRKKLIEIIQPEDADIEKRMNNFRQKVYLLRKALASSGLPEGHYIVQKDKQFYFSAEYQLETDTGQLDEIVRKIRSGVREGPEYQKLLWEFCQNYNGEFLPMLSGEEWVAVEAAYYQNWYFWCLNELCGILKQQGQFEKMLELCTAASQMHPYDDWQAMQMECLMSMNRYREALKVYEQASETFYEDLGLSSVDKVMARYRSSGGQMYYAASALTGIKNGLSEVETAEGAYQCSYPSFVDMYRVMVRMEERMKWEHVLMMCTMEKPEADESMPENADEPKKSENADDPKKPENSGERKKSGDANEPDVRDGLEQRMEQFRQVLRRGIRSGDVYTRYSENQFLVLLVGAGAQNGAAIAARLEKSWKGISGDGKTRVRFTVQKAEGPRIERKNGNETERDVRDTYRQPGERNLAGAGHLA
ncbi:MAG: BTAD domain-containing putative transcriptional regulator [Lachnospiraceae bacterium]|nr:BTAD domain-containing putative transcriptional regulator [Lachnospiraceae bacterium]